MELIKKDGTPITSLIGAKTFCRQKGLDIEKITLNEQTGTYFITEEYQETEQEPKEEPTKEFHVAKTITEAKTFEENQHMLEDAGLDAVSKEEMDEAVQQALLTIKANRLLKQQSNLQIIDNKDLSFLERIKNQPKVPVAMSPLKNANNQYEDFTEHYQKEGKPQYNHNMQPILVPYREAIINGFRFKYYLTDKLGNVITNMIPVDVAKIFADAYKFTFHDPMTNQIYCPMSFNSIKDNVVSQEFLDTFRPTGNQRVTEYEQEYAR